MNEIYGVDPEAPKDLQELRSMFERFGPSNGRFIGRYPEDWLSILESKFASLAGLDRSRLSVLLHRHRDTLLAIESQYFRTKDWADNAKNTRLFKKILSTSPNKKALPTLEEFLWDEVELDSSRGAFIPMTIEAYGQACRPLFTISSEVHMADRYFQLRRESGDLDRLKMSLLAGFLQMMEKIGKTRTLCLHFEQPKNFSRTRYEEVLKGDLDFLQADTSIDITYCAHRQMKHGRYIFSIKGGLQFDHGFRLERERDNHVHWLSTAELKPIYHTYGLAV